MTPEILVRSADGKEKTFPLTGEGLAEAIGLFQLGGVQLSIAAKNYIGPWLQVENNGSAQLTARILPKDLRMEEVWGSSVRGLLT